MNDPMKAKDESIHLLFALRWLYETLLELTLRYPALLFSLSLFRKTEGHRRHGERLLLLSRARQRAIYKYEFDVAYSSP